MSTRTALKISVVKLVRRVTLVAILAAVGLCASAADARTATVAAPPTAPGAPLKVTIASPIVSRDEALYVVHVVAAGSPIIVIASRKARAASLEVNGRIVEAVGLEAPAGFAPLGHSETSFELHDLVPADRVQIRTLGATDGALTVVTDIRTFSAGVRTGMVTGAYYAFLLLIAIFHVLYTLKAADRTNLWYALYALAILVETVARDGNFGHYTLVVLPIAGMVIAISIIGFVTSYLRILPEGKRLFAFICGANSLALLAPLVAHVYGPQVERLAFISGALVGMFAFIIAGVLRWRAGFKPARALCLCLTALPLTLICNIYFHLTGTGSPLFYHWGLEVATLFDLTVFAAAIGLRERYALAERTQLEADLSRSEHAANHDALTGLLNRRGLEAWLQTHRATVATVFFIDLDGFKAVNDRGGHAAGDNVLRVVSRIMRRSVRESDAVARIGGDEFVVAFVGDQTDATIMDLRARMASAIRALEPLGPSDATRIGASIGIGKVSPEITVDAALVIADCDAYRLKFEHYATGRTQRGDFPRPADQALKVRSSTADATT